MLSTRIVGPPPLLLCCSLTRPSTRRAYPPGQIDDFEDGGPPWAALTAALGSPNTAHRTNIGTGGDPRRRERVSRIDRTGRERTGKARLFRAKSRAAGWGGLPTARESGRHPAMDVEQHVRQHRPLAGDFLVLVRLGAMGTDRTLCYIRRFPKSLLLADEQRVVAHCFPAHAGDLLRRSGIYQLPVARRGGCPEALPQPRRQLPKSGSFPSIRW
jgi:hypothetical protein